ncbi:MAG: sulfatase/phosphatase domain-containing protein, partial [Pirellula sp.]
MPLIVRWPAQIHPGTRCDQLVGLNDWMATCADLVGATLPANAGEDSVSLRSLFTEPNHAVRDHLVHHSINGKFALREGDWKLIRFYGRADDGSDEHELYDLSSDPGERLNVFNEKPEIVARLRRLLDEFLLDTQAVIPRFNPDYDKAR